MPSESKAQQAVMGMAEAMREGKLPASKNKVAARIAKSKIKPGDLRDFATTPSANLPKKVGK